MYDILLPNGMYLGSCDLFKFLEVSDRYFDCGTSSRHICNGPLTGNRMWAINGTNANNLE